MTTRMWVTCATPEQAERLRRAGYSVTIVPSSPRPRGTRKPATARRGNGRTNLSPQVRASIEGPRLGKRYAHDAFRAADALGYTVEEAPLASLQNPRRPGVTIVAQVFVPAKLILLGDTLRGRQRNEALAHELAHGILGDTADEIACNSFTRYFLHLADDELPGASSSGARWRRWEREAHDRLCRANAGASRARQAAADAGGLRGRRET